MKVFTGTKARRCKPPNGGWQCTRVGAQANMAAISSITAAARSGDMDVGESYIHVQAALHVDIRYVPMTS
jgi:hypothetical protein